MKKKILFGVLVVLVVLGGALFYIYSQPSGKKMSDEEKKQALENLLGRDVKLTDDTPKGSSSYNGRYISFSYPAKAVIYTYTGAQAKSEQTLESFSFDIKNPKIVLNLLVKKANNVLTLSDIPSVRLREDRTYEYKKEVSTLDGEKGISFYKTGQDAEMSGFYLIDGKIYTISVTGPSSEDDRNLFLSILSSAKLKY